MKANPVLIVHGGAGHKPPRKASLDVLAESLVKGYTVLLNGGCSLDAVVSAVTVMENSGRFNAGLGGVLQLDGVQRLDASLMEGREMKAGAVAGLEGFRNPILVAQRVMDTQHVLMTDIGARRIARGLSRGRNIHRRNLRNARWTGGGLADHRRRNLCGERKGRRFLHRGRGAHPAKSARERDLYADGGWDTRFSSACGAPSPSSHIGF